MYKKIIKTLLNTIFGIYVFLLFIIPTQVYQLEISTFWGEIFPAIDIMIIYYFSSYKNTNYYLLFLIGMIIDQIYQTPIGTNSLVFIIANLGLLYINKWFALKEELTNIMIFCGYSLVVIIFRYLICAVHYKYNLIGLSICFYYLTTVTAYPLFRSLIHKVQIIRLKSGISRLERL